MKLFNAVTCKESDYFKSVSTLLEKKACVYLPRSTEDLEYDQRLAFSVTNSAFNELVGELSWWSSSEAARRPPPFL